jgi:flagellar basal body P-ring formation protein FlgA
MIRLILAAFVTLALAGISAQAEMTGQSNRGRPALKPEAIVTGDIVRIGDLIDNAGIVASVPIFRAPDLGHTGTISADAVLEAVRNHALIGIDTAGIRHVVVTRATRTIPAAVEDLIARFLSARFDLGPSKDIVVSFAREVHAIYAEPSSQGAPRVAQVDFDARSGRFDATLEIPAASGKRTMMRLLGRAAATVEVPTVTRTIERGGLIKESDVQMERRPRKSAAKQSQAASRPSDLRPASACNPVDRFAPRS